MRPSKHGSPLTAERARHAAMWVAKHGAVRRGGCPPPPSCSQPAPRGRVIRSSGDAGGPTIKSPPVGPKPLLACLSGRIGRAGAGRHEKCGRVPSHPHLHPTRAGAMMGAKTVALSLLAAALAPCTAARGVGSVSVGPHGHRTAISVQQEQ